MGWRQVVGEPLEQRRMELGYSKRAAARAAGISEITWRQLESGERQIAPGHHVEPTPEKLTKARACAAMQWSPDSIDRLLAGQAVVVINPPDAETGSLGIEARLDDLERQFREFRADVTRVLVDSAAWVGLGGLSKQGQHPDASEGRS